MLTRFILLYLFLAAFSVLANKNKTLVIYHDADYSLNQLSAKAMKMGLITAFDEVDNEIQGFALEVKEKNHRGNIKRSLLNMKEFIKDEDALFVLGGLHSPPYILNRTFMLIFLPVLGMMIAFQTFAGFNYGAQRFERVGEVLKVALIYVTGYALFWSSIMIFIPEYLFQLFSADESLIQATTEISSIVFIGFITVGIAMICPALFQALGFAKPSALLNALHTYVLLLPALGIYSISIGEQYGPLGIWWLFPITDGITAIIVGLYTWLFIKQFNQKIIKDVL